MEIFDSIAYEDVIKAIDDGPASVFYEYDLTIITPVGKVVAVRVPHRSIGRDYIGSVVEERTIVGTFTMGVYLKDIYPHRKNLRALISKYHARPTTEGQNEVAPISTMEYDALIIDNESIALSDATPASSSTVQGDKTNIVSIGFNLRDKELIRSLGQTVGNVYYKTTPTNLVKLLLSPRIAADNPPPRIGEEAVKRVKEGTGIGLNGVCIAPGSSDKGYEHIPIESGIPLKGIVKYIHDSVGLYGGGCNMFHQNGLWYVYPLANFDRVDNEVKTLTVLNVPGEKFTSMERTFRLKEDKLFVLATGNVTHEDNSDYSQLMYGNAVMYQKASNIRGGHVTTSKNVTKADYSENLVRFTLENRDSRANLINYKHGYSTDNVLKEMSELALRQTAQITFVWENSDDTLIYPGMPLKFIYHDNDAIVSVRGIVVGTSTTSAIGGTSFNSRKHTVATSVMCLVERDTE